MKYFWGYLILINLLSVIVCAADKSRARKHRWRVPEAALFLLSALGGSVGMYGTMLLIRHKTKHLKFMIGIPLIIIVQLILLLKFVIMA